MSIYSALSRAIVSLDFVVSITTSMGTPRASEPRSQGLSSLGTRLRAEEFSAGG